jgi:hypothetical protein
MVIAPTCLLKTSPSVQIYRQVREAACAADLLGKKPHWGYFSVFLKTTDAQKSSLSVSDAHHTTLEPIWHYYGAALSHVKSCGFGQLNSRQVRHTGFYRREIFIQRLLVARFPLP